MLRIRISHFLLIFFFLFIFFLLLIWLYNLGQLWSLHEHCGASGLANPITGVAVGFPRYALFFWHRHATREVENHWLRLNILVLARFLLQDRFDFNLISCHSILLNLRGIIVWLGVLLVLHDLLLCWNGVELLKVLAGWWFIDRRLLHMVQFSLIATLWQKFVRWCELIYWPESCVIPRHSRCCNFLNYLLLRIHTWLSYRLHNGLFLWVD